MRSTTSSTPPPAAGRLAGLAATDQIVNPTTEQQTKPTRASQALDVDVQHEGRGRVVAQRAMDARTAARLAAEASGVEVSTYSLGHTSPGACLARRRMRC